MTYQLILLQGQQGNPFMSLLFPLLIFGVFYFFMMRPQIKKQKDHQNFLTNLNTGVDVITNSGLIGKVTKIEGNVATLMVDEKTKVRVLKSSIQSEFKG